MNERKIVAFIVIDGGGNVRVTKRQPRLRMHEIAYRITFHMPEGWGRVFDGPHVQVPFPDLPQMDIDTDAITSEPVDAHE